MELWSDLIPPLLEKYAMLHRMRLQENWSDSTAWDIMRRYDAICFEMVEGIHTLFIEMIRNQGYVRKAFPKMDFEIYREAHLGMIAALKESLAESVQTWAAFAFHLQHLIQQLRGYCVVLRQDIKGAIHALPLLQKDRKFRQINLQAQHALVAIDLHIAKAKQLSEDIAAGQFEKAMGDFATWETDKHAIDALMAEMRFSEEEKLILRGVMGDG